MLRLPLLLLVCLAQPAWSQVIQERMTLIEAIDAVRNEGYRISYSTRLVETWMRVRETPAQSDPLEALRTALAAHALTVVAAPNDLWLVVEAPPPQPEPEPAARAVAATEEDTEPPLDEITIVASRHTMYTRDAADQFLTAEDIQRMPHVADDAFRALHRLPGVAANDFQAPFNLRGGSADEVAVLINGVELVEPFHMRTLFQPLSVVDPGIIGKADVLSGGFTAKHGRFMSGVIDVETRTAESAAIHELGVSFVSAFARSRGTFGDGRGTYFLSGRRGYLDLLADAIVDEDEELDPRYGDLFASVGYDVTDATTLTVEALLAANDVRFFDPGDGEDFGENSEQQNIWITAESDHGDGVLSRTALFASNVESLEDGSLQEGFTQAVFRTYDRDIEQLGLQTDWTVPVGENHVFEIGGRYRDLSADFVYRLNSRRTSDFVNNRAPFSIIRTIDTTARGEDYGAYVSYRHRASERLVWEVGGRWDKQTYVRGADNSQVSPRLNLLYDIGERTQLRLAWGDFYQAQRIQDLAVQDGDLTYYDAERAEHRIIGLRHKFRNSVNLQADLYQKRYRQLRPRYENLLDIYEFAPESNFDRAQVNPSAGEAYGAEITLRSAASDSLDWWLNYTWSQVEDTINGVDVARSWDQRHAVTANLSWRGERWSISLIGRYHSGWPRTPLLVDAIVDGNDNIVGVTANLSRRNSAEFDDYSRLDLRVSRRVALSRGSFEYYFEVFNLLDSSNQCCTSNHQLSIGQGLTVSPEFDEFLPFFPSFGFVWRFGPGADTN